MILYVKRLGKGSLTKAVIENGTKMDIPNTCFLYGFLISFLPSVLPTNDTSSDGRV